MKKTNRSHGVPAIAALALALGLPLKADIIYDNSINDLTTRFSPGTNEIGDQITLAGSMRFLTNFSFEFYATNTANPFAFAGVNVQARVRFYLNDGAPFNGYATPGSVIYDSGFFSVPGPTARSTFIFTAGSDFPSAGLWLPSSDMTWSVQFSGMGATDDLGVDLYDPVAVGGNHTDYWYNDAGIWTLKTNVMSVDFAARMSATVPEPSPLAMSLVGGLFLFALAKKFGQTRRTD
jgi:hypothetical protein